jgi:hypothetical protein
LRKEKASSLGLGVGLTTPHRKNKLLTKIHKRPWTWTDSLDDQVKEDEMGRACNTNAGEENAYRILVGKPKGKRP